MDTLTLNEDREAQAYITFLLDLLLSGHPLGGSHGQSGFPFFSQSSLEMPSWTCLDICLIDASKHRQVHNQAKHPLVHKLKNLSYFEGFLILSGYDLLRGYNSFAFQSSTRTLASVLSISSVLVQAFLASHCSHRCRPGVPTSSRLPRLVSAQNMYQSTAMRQFKS